jgi:hypothetical protein
LSEPGAEANAVPVRSSFASVACSLLPADGRRGVAVEAGLDWAFDATAVPSDADVVVWGRLADGASGGVRAAGAREAALRGLARRLPASLSIAAVHRLAPHRLRPGLRSGLRAALRAGAVVELTANGGGRRIVDAVGDALGAVALRPRIAAGAGGTTLVRARLADGSHALLRVAAAGAPGDPAPLADTLERLAAAGVPLAPRPLGRGRVARASWTAEQALPGRRPARATRGLVSQVASACARLPRSDGPPTAAIDDLLGAAQRLPERAAPLRALAADLAPVLGALPAVLRHGDLWTGNLLVERGRLVGIVDWDAAHHAGVPGADLLQLLATDTRMRAHEHLGPAFVARPWRSAPFRRATAAYWRALGLAPEPEILDAVAIAWWASEVHHTLVRVPHRAVDEGWVAVNVDAVLAALGR